MSGISPAGSKPNGIVLTDALTPPLPVARCPKHPTAEIVAVNMARTHGCCAVCGFEPLELSE